MITLKAATVKDIELIRNLATAIWHAHYIDIIGLQQVEYMLDKMYDAQSLTKQLTEEGHRFYFIETKDAIIGFISVSTSNQKDYFIHKFYIQQTASAKGVGTITLNELTNLLKPKTYTLTVNRQNYKSINFYFKNGFVINEVADFDIGNGYLMNDFVMKKMF